MVWTIVCDLAVSGQNIKHGNWKKLLNSFPSGILRKVACSVVQWHVWHKSQVTGADCWTDYGDCFFVRTVWHYGEVKNLKCWIGQFNSCVFVESLLSHTVCQTCYYYCNQRRKPLGPRKNHFLINHKDSQVGVRGERKEERNCLWVLCPFPNPWRKKKYKKMLDVLEEKTYWSGEGIFLQGENAENFYILSLVKAKYWLKS